MAETRKAKVEVVLIIFPPNPPYQYERTDMAEPRKAKVEVVFAADGVEVVRLYGTSWSDQEPALALYRQLAPLIRQVHVRFREEPVRPSGGSPSPENDREMLSTIKRQTQSQRSTNIRRIEGGAKPIGTAPAPLQQTFLKEGL